MVHPHLARMDPNAAVQHRKDKEREEAFESAISKAPPGAPKMSQDPGWILGASRQVQEILQAEAVGLLLLNKVPWLYHGFGMLCHGCTLL